jgi:hypothetical protein
VFLQLPRFWLVHSPRERRLPKCLTVKAAAGAVQAEWVDSGLMEAFRCGH